MCLRYDMASCQCPCLALHEGRNQADSTTNAQQPASSLLVYLFTCGFCQCRSAALGMLRTFTGAARQEDLAPAPPDRVWYRCCYNLISLYHNISSFPILRSILNLALAVSPADASGTYSKISADLRMLRAQVPPPPPPTPGADVGRS